MIRTFCSIIKQVTYGLYVFPPHVISILDIESNKMTNRPASTLVSLACPLLVR